MSSSRSDQQPPKVKHHRGIRPNAREGSDIGTPAPTLPEGRPAILRHADSLQVEEAKDRFRDLIALVFITVVALGALGTWAYLRVDASLRELRAAGLGVLLESESRILEIWIEEKKRDAERWAGTPRIEALALGLAGMAERGLPPGEICRSPAHQALVAEIAPHAALEETATFNLWLPDGRVIASLHAASCGRSIQDAGFMKLAAPVFAGASVFVQPWLESKRLGIVADAPLNESLVWVQTPVRDAAGRVIAALGFGRVTSARFAKLLAITGTESSREAFAFDAQGAMLTQGRYEAQAQPLAGSELGKAAIKGLREGGAEGLRGVVLEPYRSYRGVEVIGAWRWLPRKEMAIGVEIEAEEAYAPLHYLEVAFGIILAFLVATTLAAAGMSLWAVRLRLREARRLGQYTLLRPIGEGGLSHVYLARHSRLKRPAAVKVLKRHLANEDVVARFEREVQHCSQLTHPNTVEIFDFGRTRDGTFFYAMEYLDGVSLQDLVADEGPMPTSRVVHALRQACGSLREAHGRGLVHRDIKPANLMLCAHGGQLDVLKVLDFGLVKETSNPHTRDITQHAKVLGTPLYMAPERLRNPADADARADIYALGAVAFFLLTGRKLFVTETEHDLVYRVLNEEAPLPSACGARDVPAILEALIARCLSKDRDARPATIDEVDAVLSEVARQRPWTEAQSKPWWDARPKPSDGSA